MTTPDIWRRAIPAAGWSLLTAALLLVPGEEVPDPGFFDRLDKPGHALLFAVHFVLLRRALAAWPGRDVGLAVPAALSGIYGLLLEAAQTRVPGRSWDLWDLVADFAGIALVALWLVRRRARLPGAF